MARLTTSFEFFPPKTEEGKATLQKTALQLATIHPQFFSVTYGAGGSTRTGTIETVEMLQQKFSVAVTPHLSCIGLSRNQILETLMTYQQLGATRIVALRGDVPSGMGQSSEFPYASDLVKLIREVTGNHFHIEVAAYPEFHPQAESAHDDVLNLKIKIEAGANSAITQYFYNPDAYFNFLDECAKCQIFAPIVPGIMPIHCFTKLKRFSDACGAEIPRWIGKRLESYRDDTASIQSFGLEVVYNLCQRLLSGGAPGLHFYTLNQAEPSLNLAKMLGLFAATPVEAEKSVERSSQLS
jgi:methylenetetrahydrofolate reductase (NADPH)